MLRGDHQAEIEAGHDVGPAVGEHQVDLGRPAADPLGVAQHGDGGFVVHRVEGREIDAAFDDVGGEAAAVAHLGARQADRAQLLVAERQEVGRLHARHGLLQSQPDAARGMDGDLLTDDGTHQAVEAARHLAQRGMPDLGDRARKVGIDGGQMLHGCREVGRVENHPSHASGIARRWKRL